MSDDVQGPEIPDPVQYLQKHESEYPWAGLWTEHGRRFDPPTQEAVDDWHSRNLLRGRRGRCFTNSLLSCFRYKEEWPEKEVLYVEGIAWTPQKGPIKHAWCLVEGIVVDNTWLSAWQCAWYFGVTFDPKIIDEWSSRTGNGIVTRQGWAAGHGLVTEHLKAR